MRQPIITPVLLVMILASTVGVTGAATQARVAGVVVSTDGEPVPDATITITCDALPKYNKVVTTDDDGEFKLLILDATQTYLFSVSAPGYIDYGEAVKVGVGTTDNELSFELTTPEERAAAQQEELMKQPGYKEYGEAADLLAAGDTVQARALFEEAVAAEPDLIEAYEALAEIDYDSGDDELALATARRCLEVDDESLTCLAIASNAAGDLGDTEAQSGYLATYQELNPDDPVTVFNQAAALLNKMDDEGARPLLEQCLDIDPAFAKCLFEYGMLLLRSGDLEGAKVQLEKYLEVAPDGADAATAAETVKYL